MSNEMMKGRVRSLGPTEGIIMASHAGGESFSTKFGVVVLSIELIVAILYGTFVDYKIYTDSTAATTNVNSHYGYYEPLLTLSRRWFAFNHARKFRVSSLHF